MTVATRSVPAYTRAAQPGVWTKRGGAARKVGPRYTRRPHADESLHAEREPSTRRQGRMQRHRLYCRVVNEWRLLELCCAAVAGTLAQRRATASEMQDLHEATRLIVDDVVDHPFYDWFFDMFAKFVRRASI